jgi:hypothetical protein
MSLEKAIKHGKEKRKPYYRSGKFDPTCRPNGGCPWCQNNRAHKKRKKEGACQAQLKDYNQAEDESSSQETIQ